MKLFVFTFFVSILSFGNAQELKTIAKLPASLAEISGLTFLNDTILVAHNDGGNEPVLYFLNLKGDVVHKVEITDAKNKDWEAIAFDGKYIYIGDIGNNNNSRKDLVIYKVSSADILKRESVKAEKIEISYAEQIAFPPADKLLYFDAEALAFYNDSLHIFTKCRTKPFNGISFQYTVSTKPGKYVLTSSNKVCIGDGGFYRDAITDVAIHNDVYWFLTYNRIVGYHLKDNTFELQRTIKLHPYTQKEALITRDNINFYLADEKQRILGGGKLYKLILDDK